MNNIFNSSFETGLRVLLVLSSILPNDATLDRIAAYDFIIIYGKDFGISKINLHGDSNFNFSELASKRFNCYEGIKEFVLYGLISIHNTERGFTYTINKKGINYVQSLYSEYAETYLSISQEVHKYFSNYSDEDVINYINKKAIEELRRK